MRFNHKFILSCVFILMSSSLFASEEKVEYLGLFSMQKTSYKVGSGDNAIDIKRVLTSCAKNKGFLQDLVPVEGIHPATEIQMLYALNDKDALVVDMRTQEQYFEQTIPTAINIPFGDIEVRMDELGCEEVNDKWNCTHAKKVYGFCNGPVCVQSPIAMKIMVENGFPADKIHYYRGGMLTWSVLGLTTVKGKF